MFTEAVAMTGPSWLVSACAAESLPVREGLAVAFLLDPLTPREGFGLGCLVELDKLPVDLLELARWGRWGELEAAVFAVGEP